MAVLEDKPDTVDALDKEIEYLMRLFRAIVDEHQPTQAIRARMVEILGEAQTLQVQLMVLKMSRRANGQDA